MSEARVPSCTARRWEDGSNDPCTLDLNHVEPHRWPEKLRYIEFDGGERRLPMVQRVADLPASTDAPLPVTCFVRGNGIYQMVEQGQWRLLRPLTAP